MDSMVKPRIDFPVILKSDLLDNFSKEFNLKLRLYYPDMLCSNAFVSDQFNTRSSYDYWITRETARRWLKGEMMPEYTAMFTLRAWLGLDINALLPFDPILKTEITLEPPKHLTQEEIQNQMLQSIESIDKVQLELKRQRNSLVQIQLANILS
jgi:hypothetical protein